MAKRNEITVTVKRDGHEYEATVNRLTGRVDVTQDGHVAGNGHWSGERIDACAAHLGDSEEQSERAYEALDEAIADALVEAGEGAS